MQLTDISILFVEDEDISKEMISNFLHKQFFKNIYTAKNGLEGLKLYKKIRPEIVLTDLTMPVMNGLEMSEQIKALDADTPIILITSHFEKDLTEKAIDIGIDSYLFKPLHMERLEIVLQKYCDRLLTKKNFQTEHKLLEEYKRAIDASAAITKTDTQGIITYVNDAFCLMSGYSKEELLGQKYDMVRDPETPESVYIDIWHTISSKQIWRGRMKNLKKNGDTYYEYSVVVPIVNKYDDIEEYIALRQDITVMYHQQEHLIQRIKEEVDKNTLFHQQREEENLLEAKFSTIGKIAAGITHEINTPLTYVRGNLELMAYDVGRLDNSIPQKEFFQNDIATMLDGLNRIAGIVESMREMASQTSEMPDRHNLYSSLATVIILSQSKAKFISKVRIKNEVFHPAIDKERFKYYAKVQKQRIEQVFIIIINNALDALALSGTFESRILEIEIEHEFENIVIRFKDNAGGIQPAILSSIFEPFKSTKQEGGMGMGLNVAKRIVDDHHGKLTASNHADGALFEVSLPINADKEYL
ncbi:MAG: response regulator [Sulfurimonas sp.]|nr:response regulator [Sulfurimonas sp.]MBU3938861.1 response regulator [bacterium]MBU4025236.1 response regulator [bacterium]MBU4059417.1 response regulator [bacterium]